mmetsp:Transcript_126397/g.404682  ORF Transcript_126397/g.404682 Transcript_126397/m.404682 type:complete len:231 (+) Transcript_126397:741-1433(+)
MQVSLLAVVAACHYGLVGVARQRSGVLARVHAAFRPAADAIRDAEGPACGVGEVGVLAALVRLVGVREAGRCKRQPQPPGCFTGARADEVREASPVRNQLPDGRRRPQAAGGDAPTRSARPKRTPRRRESRRCGRRTPQPRRRVSGPSPCASALHAPRGDRPGGGSGAPGGRRRSQGDLCDRCGPSWQRPPRGCRGGRRHLPSPRRTAPPLRVCARPRASSVGGGWPGKR